MITASLTALIVSLCALFGVHLGVAEIAAVAITMKVLVVSGLLGFGLRWWRGRQQQALQGNLPPLGAPSSLPPAPPSAAAPPEVPGPSGSEGQA